MSEDEDGSMLWKGFYSLGKAVIADRQWQQRGGGGGLGMCGCPQTALGKGEKQV